MSPDSSEPLFIVLVDDDPRIHQSIKTIIDDAGIARRLESFYDPVSFLEFLKGADALPDIVLLDVHFENSGLSGVEILPFIREDYPFLPVILLTGMEGSDIEESQDFECVYYIPKPVSPEQLVRMIRYYLGMARKSSERTAELSRDLAEHKKLVSDLKTEIAQAEIASWDEGDRDGKETDACSRILEILRTVLKNCEPAPSFIKDVEDLFRQDFNLLKKAVDTLVHFDLSGIAAPGLNIHRHHCVPHVYSLRLTKKARLFFFHPPGTNVKHLLRIDPHHDTVAMDKWLKSNEERFLE